MCYNIFHDLILFHFLNTFSGTFPKSDSSVLLIQSLQCHTTFLNINRRVGRQEGVYDTRQLKYPAEFNFKEWKPSWTGKAVLKHVVLHSGTLMDGHYTCLSNREDTWVYMNDESSSPTTYDTMIIN